MRALLDTSALVLLDRLVDIPDGWKWSLSALSYAELEWGVQRCDGAKRARRAQHVALIRAVLGHGLPFDDACAARHGFLSAVTEETASRPRRRTMDLLIAATAARHHATLVTANIDDVRHLREHLAIAEVTPEGQFIREPPERSHQDNEEVRLSESPNGDPIASGLHE